MLASKSYDSRLARKGNKETGTGQKRLIKKTRDDKVRKEGSSANTETIETFLLKLKMKKLKRFSHHEIVKFTSNLSQKTSSDAFGNIYIGELPKSVRAAVKVLIENDVAQEIFMAEVTTLALTDHPNIHKLFGFCFDPNMKALVYEYVENGPFHKILYNRSHNIEWNRLYDIAVDIARALLYLHEGCCKQIIHQDVKVTNILLDSSFSPKLSGFGLAMPMKKGVSHFNLTETRGSPSYAAPEMWMPLSKVTFKCDVYSFGMLLFEVLRRKNNMDGEDWFPTQVWDRFEKAQLDELIEECGVEKDNRRKAKVLSSVALWCIQFTPQSRPTMNTVVEVLEKEIQVTSPPNPFSVSSNITIEACN